MKTFFNPEGLVRNPAFTQAIAVDGSHRTIYVGGQDAVDADGNVVGEGSLETQTRQVFHNLKDVLSSAGARLEDVVKWTVYILSNQLLAPAFQVFQEEWGRRANPPTITVLRVAGLAGPKWLIEIDAIAVVPE
jgi:enamine deaminase RidA (YjgF/YER057c/UK114 family)